MLAGISGVRRRGVRRQTKAQFPGSHSHSHTRSRKARSRRSSPRNKASNTGSRSANGKPGVDSNVAGMRASNRRPQCRGARDDVKSRGRYDGDLRDLRGGVGQPRIGEPPPPALRALPR